MDGLDVRADATTTVVVPAAHPVRQAGVPVLVVSAAARLNTAPPRAAARAGVPRPPVPPAPRTPAPHPVPPPAPPSPTVRRQVSPRDRFTPLRVVWLQLAAVAVVASVGRPWPVVVGVAVGALALVALTVLRRGGRPLHRIAASGVGFLSRARRHNLPEDGKALALLDLLLPGATTAPLETAHGQALAISHPGGLTTVVRPRSTGAGPVRLPPPPADLLPAVDGDRHRFGVQSVFHVGAVPGGRPRFWLAVHATRTVDALDDGELALALRNAVRRVLRALDQAGVPAETMPVEAALATIGALGHVTGGRTEVREDWRFWRTGVVSHACFRLAGWERLTGATAALLLGGVPARVAGVAATVTTAARSGPDRPRLDAVLRLAATTESAVEHAATALASSFAPFDVRLVRLDGSHLAGVAAALPIGGFPE